MKLRHNYYPSTLWFLLAIFSANAHASFDLDPSCGNLNNNYLGKPTDYRTAPTEQRNLVERRHFNVEHAQIQKGRSTFKHGENSGSLMGGFDYTLRVFPNHHLALQDIDRLGLMLKSEKPLNASYTLECYYKRAVAFVPDDAVVRLLYGLYLNRRGKTQEALEQLRFADENSPDDTNVQYNLGLAYFQLKEYEKAREYAKRAYDRGFPLPGLKNMLIKAGKWD
ncbi:MAG: tetratricopeptide repeat protein [Dechloromonas sp.]|nr:MAG: tetratricopeptide repeat protein [Dechloromonas sp.]